VVLERATFFLFPLSRLRKEKRIANAQALHPHPQRKGYKTDADEIGNILIVLLAEDSKKSNKK